MSVTPWSEGIFYLPTELVQYGVDVYEATALQPNVGNNPSVIPTSYWTIYSQGGSNVVSSVSAGLGIAVTGGGTTNPVVAANLEAGTGVTIGAGVAPQSLLISSAADGVLSVTGTAGQIGAATAAGAVTLTNLGVLGVTAAIGCTVGGTAANPTIGTNLVAGNGIQVLPGVGTTVDISNLGILSVDTGGAGITATTISGNTTLNNTGVTSVIAGSGISVSAATGAVTISSTGGGSPPTPGAGISVAGTAVSMLATNSGTLTFPNSGSAPPGPFTYNPTYNNFTVTAAQFPRWVQVAADQNAPGGCSIQVLIQPGAYTGYQNYPAVTITNDDGNGVGVVPIVLYIYIQSPSGAINYINGVVPIVQTAGTGGNQSDVIQIIFTSTYYYLMKNGVNQWYAAY
jgi:hypothetical protein